MLINIGMRAAADVHKWLVTFAEERTICIAMAAMAANSPGPDSGSLVAKQFGPVARGIIRSRESKTMFPHKTPVAS